MSHNVTPNTSRVELRKTLTLVPVVMMGLAYMQPMTLFDTFGIVSGLTDGHVPTAYAFALIAILFTALSYGKLVRRYPSAGSAYTYAQKSISPTVGFMVGWSSLLDYLFAPMINILLAKIYFEALVPSIPSWMFVVALVAFMTAFNLRSLKSVANFNTVIVVLQIVLIAVILGMVVYGVFEGEGAGTLASTRPFWSGDAHVIPMITGPNTGGMGAYSPAPVVTDEVHQRTMERIIWPTVKGMAAEGNTYTGFLYAGLMIDKQGNPKVIEFNCRFGDPETQPIMLRMKSDLVELCLAACEGTLDEKTSEWDERASLGVVMAAGGYPGDYRTGDVIHGLPLEEVADGKVFHAGTKLADDEQVVTSGGRVLCVTALGHTVAEAQKRAYALMTDIHWDDCFCRKDIGWRAIEREQN